MGSEAGSIRIGSEPGAGKDEGADGSGWVVWANIFTGSSGWDGFDGTVDPEAGYYFSCDLNAPDDASSRNAPKRRT